jgi:hypothetical protein
MRGPHPRTKKLCQAITAWCARELVTFAEMCRRAAPCGYSRGAVGHARRRLVDDGLLELSGRFCPDTGRPLWRLTLRAETERRRRRLLTAAHYPLTTAAQRRSA